MRLHPCPYLMPFILYSQYLGISSINQYHSFPLHSQVLLTLMLEQSFKYSYLRGIVNACCALGGSLYFTSFILCRHCGKCQKKVSQATVDFHLLLCVFPYVIFKTAQLLTLFLCHVLHWSATWEQWNHISSGENRPWLLFETIITSVYNKSTVTLLGSLALCFKVNKALSRH